MMMKIVQVAALLCATNLMLFHQHWPPLAARPMGRLTGVVADINEARIPGATILVTGEGATRRVTTDEEGTYQIELPTGIYRLRVESVGFCPTRRAAIHVQPSTATAYNFNLIPCPISNVLTIANGQYKGEADRYRDPFKEEVFPMVSSAGAPLELLVRYGKRREDKNIIEYRGTVVSYDEYANNAAGSVSRNKYLGAMISYDSLMVCADMVRLDPSTFRLEAEGNVVVEDGKRYVRVRHAVVNLGTGVPMLELTQ